MTSQTVDALFNRHGPAYKWLATATVMLGTLSMVLETTIINVAIPEIMRVFDLGHDQAQWLSTGFLAAMTATMLVTAWCVAAFGQRATYIGAMAVFAAACVLGATSPWADVVILARVVQGAMAGIIQPLAMISIFQVFPERERGRGMGIYGVGVIMGPAIAPALGGVLVDLFSWRAVFLVSLPSCLLGILMALRYMPDRDSGSRRPTLDLIGFALLCTTLTAILWALSNGERRGWDDLLVVASLTTGVMAALGFIARSFQYHTPLLDLRVFARPGFAVGAVLAFCLGAGLFGSTYLIPLFVQEVQGLSATRAGLLLMPAGLMMAAVFPLAGFLADRGAPHRPVVFGLVCFAVSCALLASADRYTVFSVLALWAVVGRLGLGLMLPPINTTALRILGPRLIPQGAGAINFARQLGGAFGVNLLAIALERRREFHTGELLSQGIDASQGLLARATGSVPSYLSGNPQVSEQALRTYGYSLGFQDSFLALATVFVLALIPGLFMGRYARRLQRG